MRIIKQSQGFDLNWTAGEITPNGIKTTTEANIPLELTDIDHKTIKVDEQITIPYNSPALREQVQSLMDEIAQDYSWIFPDYDAARMSILINPDKQSFDALLMIQVEPPRYTEQNKAATLDHANKEPLNGEAYSDYDNWCTIFDTAEAFHSGGMTCDNNPVGFYNLELEPAEQNILQWLVIQRLNDELGEVTYE